MFVHLMTYSHVEIVFFFFFFSSRRRHTRFDCDWSSDVCSSDLDERCAAPLPRVARGAAELLGRMLAISADVQVELGMGRELGDAPRRQHEIGRASCRERV